MVLDPHSRAEDSELVGRRRFFLLVVLVLYLTCLFHLGTLPLIGADEPRYARIGEEMLLYDDFVTPRLGGEAWLEKPPLLFWVEAASYSLSGVSEWSARLPSALLSLACVGAAGWLLSRLGRPRPARLVLLILPTAPLYAAFARSATTDIPLVACLSVALITAFLAAREGRLRWSVASGLALGLAILAKGPVALVLYGLIVGGFSVLAWRWIWSPAQLSVSAGLAFLVAAPWFWLVWRANGNDFIVTFVINHHLARYLTAVHRHDQPIWFYGGVILLGFFPWVLFLGSSLMRLRRQIGSWDWSQPPLVPFLWVWVAAPVLFFSLSESKLAGYIMPVFPALALLCALEWDRYLEGDVSASRTMRRQLVLLMVMAGVIAGVLVAGSRAQYEYFWPGIVLATPVLLGCAGAWFAFVRRRGQAIVLHLAAAMTVLVAAAYWLVAPVVGPYHSVRELVRDVRPHLSASEPLIQYRCFHHSALYYSDYRTTVDAVEGMIALSNYFDAFPQERYFLLVKRPGLTDLLVRFGELESVRRKGPFYVVELVAVQEP